MTHIEFLVEEPSIEAALGNLLPRILGDGVTFQLHVYQGKPDLLSKLPVRLRGYQSWLPADWKIVVLVDEDREDCRELKEKMERIAQQAGLATKSRPDDAGTFQVINRIAIEELEAWFFGDVDALRRAFPRIPETLHRQQRYRDPDAIAGGTWEALARLLVRKKYHRHVHEFPKIETARRVSAHMEPERNRSQSFQAFYTAVREIARAA